MSGRAHGFGTFINDTLTYEGNFKEGNGYG